VSIRYETTRHARYRIVVLTIILPCVLFFGGISAAADDRPFSGFNGAVVTGIRYWSNGSYTRVVVDVDRDVTYDEHILKEDVSLGKPPRLYLDLKWATLAPQVGDVVRVDDKLLKVVRAGQFTPAIVRVVLDLENLWDHKVFCLNDPFRIVVDVYGVSPGQKGEEGGMMAFPSPVNKVRPITVVLDPGHGGTDPGAIGPGGLQEKQVVLQIARRLKVKLEKSLQARIVMTREDDRFVPLEERTAIANTSGGDLFVSIHTNASRKRHVSGVETYFLNSTTDQDALRLAAQESGVSPERISDLQLILYDLMLNNKVDESSQLAESVQMSLVTGLQRKFSKVNDLGVKQAPFVVLMGAKMPSILAEVSFISNGTEEKRLRDGKYLDQLATSLCEGIVRYLQDTHLVKHYPPVTVSKALTSN